jgi:hypothetical protein
MNDLEQQIAAWVDTQTADVEPVTVDEVLGHHSTATAPAPSPLGPSRWGPRAALVAAAVVLVLVAVVGALVATGHRDEQPATPTPAGVEDTVTYTEPEFGWSLDYPRSWSLERWTGACEGLATTIVTNRPEPPSRTPAGGVTCGSEWDTRDEARPGFVGFEVQHFQLRGDIGRSNVDTALPLRLEDLPQNRPVQGAGDGAEGQSVRVDGDDGYFVRVWVAPDADPEDVDALRRTVASLRWPTSPVTRSGSGYEIGPATLGPGPATMLACMIDRGHEPQLTLAPPTGGTEQPQAKVIWPAAESSGDGTTADLPTCESRGDDALNRLARDFSAWPERAGPSQSAADGERDHVIAAVAALPLEDRAASTTWFDADEGTWALTQMPERSTGDGSYDCTVGDPNGVWGEDYVCAAEYGEILLVDEAGAIVRAYPMPGAAPTWITATRDAVYAGRAGDEGSPGQTIVRIDRTTLKAEVLVFAGSNAILGVTFPGWRMAPDGADIAELVRVGDQEPDPARTLVSSSAGVTSVDLPAIEKLFA